MTDNQVLEALKQYIEREVATHVLLKKPTLVNQESTLVKPIVCIGYLPPKNFLPEGHDVPAIIVGMEEGEDNNDEASLRIRISFVTYDGGSKDNDGNFIADMQGYKDLLNIMTRTRLTISSNPVIDGVTVVDKPIKWGMYDEQPWPYWYGWLTCSTSIAAMMMTNNKHEQYL